MHSSTREPSHSRIHGLLARFAAVLLVGVLSAVAVGTPVVAAPRPAGNVYQPTCYYLCLSYTYDSAIGWHVTATTYLYDVGPTPYYISIFDAFNGERIAICGAGTQCPSTNYLGSVTGPGNCYTFIAYVGGSGTSMPPAPVQLTSPTLTKCIGAG